MKVEITNLQRTHRVGKTALRDLARWLMARASALDASKTWIECSVVLVDSKRMEELNRSSLEHEGTTDVITFAYPTSPGEADGWRGEIIINTELAYTSGSKRKGGPDRELALYLAHGCQHLGGADDRTQNEREAMNRRQNHWLRQADAEGLVCDLFK